MSPEEFSSQLFVGREPLLERLTRWATAEAVRRRLRTVAAPPGYGKTWLLRELERRLKERPDGLFIIRAPTPQLTSVEAITGWLPEVVLTAQAICPKVRNIAPGDSPQTAIARLLQGLAQTCSPPRRVLLFVDGLDEISGSAQKELARHLLEPFWQEPSVRMVISFRDDYSLRSHLLRRGETRISLDTFSGEDGKKQLEKRARLAGETLPVSQDDLLKLVAPYSLNVPGINTILSRRIKQNEAQKRAPLLSADDVRDCRRELVGEEAFQKIPRPKEDIEADLQRITRYAEDSWTVETFARICDCTINEAYNYIRDLQKLTVVVGDDENPSRYKIVDGIRELLRAEQRLRRNKEENR